jgi:ribosomal protein S18 acetylase RimI-like enzyme
VSRNTRGGARGEARPVVREMLPPDLGQVRTLLAELAAYTAHGDVNRGEADREGILAAMTRMPDIYSNWVAVEGARVVGFLSLVFYKTLFHAGGTALINELVVAGDRRGRGIGRALVARAAGEAQARGMDEIEVGTEKGNAAAQSFYRAVGFDEEYVLLGMEFDAGPGGPGETGGSR